jgi:hypothetical protein
MLAARRMKWLGIGVYGLACLAAIVLGIPVRVGVSLSLTLWLFDQIVGYPAL